MLTIQEDEYLIRVEVSGKLSEDDYEVFVPLFERIAARAPGTVPMLIELAPDFTGWDLVGLWRDLKFDMRHKDRFGRTAIVGTKNWEEWGTKLSDPIFPGTELRFFEARRVAGAKAWARGLEEDRPV